MIYPSLFLLSIPDEFVKEKNEIISKITNLQKEYSTGNLIDEEYEELRRPLDEKVKKIDEELRRLSLEDSDDITPKNEENGKTKSGWFKNSNGKSSISSYIILFLITGILGSLFFAFLGLYLQ